MTNYRKDYLKYWSNIGIIDCFRILDGDKVISPNTNDLNELHLRKGSNFFKVDLNFYWKDDATDSLYIYENYGIMTENLKKEMQKEHGERFTDFLKDE